MGHGLVTFSGLKSVWRILVAIAVCDLLGGAISLYISPHYSSFLNFSLGCGLATLPGFAIGLAWQVKARHDRQVWIGMACFFGFLALITTVETLARDLPSMRSEMRLLQALSRMQTENIHQIDVFDSYGNQKLLCITDPASLNAFAQGIADAVGHEENHPVYSQTWYVVVEGTICREFELNLDPMFPQSVIGEFVVKSGNSTSYNGTFRSKGLRPWCEENLIRRISNRRGVVTQ
ncbi:MAG: hypothetical protein ABSA67_08750 [Candidatus Brocadiia bacterium]|jgi:hypothetical protein